ncbi:MAG: NADH-quinone oxidoreductase subunit NuoN [Pseudomonadota bacterium]
MGLIETLSYVVPELMLALGAMALLTFGVLQGDRSTGTVSIASMGLLIAAALVVMAGYGGDTEIFDGAFRIDAFSGFCKILIFGAAAIAILMSDKYLAGEQLGRFEYPILILLASFGMALMVSANDLIALYMSVEMQSLALYILAAFNRESRRSTEAGLKYFVLGALSSGLLLYGASLVYGFSGSTSFVEIARVAAATEGANVGLVVGLVFLVAGLAFKVSAAPFHMWTPDVYEGAPTPVTAFFAAAPKLAAMALFARALVSPFLDVHDQWQPVIAMIAVASMAIGSFSAIVQSNIKRLMAYSSIGHMGFALVGLAAGTKQGVSAVLIYMAIYLVMTIGTFACILLMRRRGGQTESLDDLSGLSESQPGLAILFTVLFFSLAGVPPTGGFFGKLFVFNAAVQADLIWLAVVGVLLSAIAAYYYLRVIWIIWFNEAGSAFEREAGTRLGVIATVSALIMMPILLIGIAPLRAAADAAAGALF